jgi:hypothetical protein
MPTVSVVLIASCRQNADVEVKAEQLLSHRNYSGIWPLLVSLQAFVHIYIMYHHSISSIRPFI